MSGLLPVCGQQEAAAMTAEVIEKITGISRNRQYGLSEKKLNELQWATGEAFLQKLQTGMPLQYALGEAWFCNRSFQINTSVLIPRPETEELVMLCKQAADNNAGLRVLDIGTGSGCIGITLKLECPAWNVTLMDVSEEALATAKGNAERLGAAITVLHFDFLNREQWPDLGRFDLIVSNPPYIPENEAALLDAHVKDWEPALALFTPARKPVLFYEEIAAFCQNGLSKGGKALLEGHYQLMDAASACFRNVAANVQIHNDMSGNPRFLIVQQA